MGMMRDCQVVSSREGSREVMSGRIRLPSSQYHDVRSTASLLFLPVSDPPQMADVACASVPAQTLSLATCVSKCPPRFDQWILLASSHEERECTETAESPQTIIRSKI